MKYRVTISEGCTAFYTEINEKIVGGEYEPTCLTDEEVDEFVDYLCKKFKTELKEGTVILDDLIKCFQSDRNETDEHDCEQCGDTVSRTVWEF
jgi:hypothetical protein